MLNQQEQNLRKCAVVCIRDVWALFFFFKKPKVVSSSTRHGGSSNNNSSSTSRAHEARVSIAIRSACRSNPPLHPLCLYSRTRFMSYVFLLPTSKFRIIIWRRKIYNLTCPTERSSRSRPLLLLYDIYAELLKQRNSSSSSSSSRTHKARVSVALRSACQSNPCTLCTRA